MPATPFSAEVRPAASEATIVLHGDVDAAADPALAQAAAAAVAAGASTLVLDFGDVRFMNSTGIALIVELLSDAMRDHRPLAATGLSPHYREIFEITRLSDHIALLPEQPPEAPATRGESA